MNEGPLLSDCLLTPLLVGAWVLGRIDVFVHFSGESVCESIKYHRVVDVESRMAHCLFKLGDVSVQLFALHFEPLAKHYLRLLLFEYVGVLSIEGSGSALPEPFIGHGDSSTSNLETQPCAH